MKFALLTVSYSGLFYQGDALSLEQQIRKAHELGFDGLSIETKRPVASPLDLSKSDRQRIKDLASDVGIELVALESLSNFSSRLMEQRENNLAMMRMVLDLAKDLGISMVKIFAAWPGLMDDEEEVAVYGPYERGNYFKRQYPAELRRWRRAVAGIKEIAHQAADMGITLALQNHTPVIRPGYEDALAMLRQVGSPNLKLCLDVPLFYERQQDDYVLEALRQCGDLVVLSHYGAWNFAESADGKVIQQPAPSFGGLINYETYYSGLQKIGYQGYLVSEYCLPVIKDYQLAGIEEIDRATRMGLHYMKELVANPAPVPV